MKKLSAQFKQKGFTLIELLVVIVIIATLAVTVFVALNPAGRLADARDARRTSDVNSILTAVHQYIVDQSGILPNGLTAPVSSTQLGTAGACPTSRGVCGTLAATCLNLSSDLAPYLASIPLDPSGTTLETGYSFAVNTSGIVTVTACESETGTIQSSR